VDSGGEFRRVRSSSFTDDIDEEGTEAGDSGRDEHQPVRKRDKMAGFFKAAG